MQLLLMLCFSDSLIFVCCMFKKKMMFHIVEVNDYSRKSYSLKGAIFGIRFPGCCGPCFRVLFQLKVFQLSYIFEDVVLYCRFVELFFVVVVLIWFLCKKKFIYMKMNCSCIVLVLYFQECLRLPSFFFTL